MGRKKSRTGGLIGVRKTDAPRVKKEERQPKKTKGNKAGTRQLVAEEADNNARKQRVDPRVGSKKPIDLKRHLGKSTVTAPQKPKFETPKQELSFIEQDEQLQTLLDKQETKKLAASEQEYVTKMLDRHKVLCELLGIEDEEIEDDNDPLDDFEAISIDDYKD